MRGLLHTARAIPFLVALVCPASASVVGPGPHDVEIPSTGQRLSIVITHPADGDTIPITPGTGDFQGKCAIGAVPPESFNVVYVVDVSGSTDLAFMRNFGTPLVDVDGDGTAGDAGDDVNGDGQAGDILDGELAGVLALNTSLGGAGTVSVGVVAFAAHAANADMAPADGVQAFTGLATDGDGDGVPDVVNVLRSVDSSYNTPSGGQIGKFTLVPRSTLGSQTNFTEALRAANAALAQFPPADRNLVFFLSDGRSDPGARCVEGRCAAELATAVAAHTTINTYGVGTAIDVTDLRFIATQTGGTFTPVPEPAQLSAVIPTIAPAGLDHAEVDGVTVPLDALGRFGTTLTCHDRVPFDVTARCVATDPVHTAVTADVTVTCVGECGDGHLDPGEECDDGNTLPGDCCGTDCHLEPDGSRCADDGDVCNGESVCHAGACGAATPTDALACGMAHQVAVVSNFGDDTVSLLDAKTGTVSDPVRVANGPWGVAIHPRGGEMWVTDRKDNLVSVLDAATGRVTASIAVGIGRLPLGVVFSPDGTRGYVASYDEDRVDVVDVATRTVIAHVPVGRGPSGLAFDPAGQALYVANYADDTVSVLDAATNTILTTTPAGHRPLQIAIDPIRGRAFVSDFGSSKVSVLGTVSRTVLRTVRVGRQPFGVAVDPARGRAFVSNAGGNSVAILDTATAQLVTTARVGKGPLGIGVDLTGRAWVSNGTDGTLQVLDPTTGTVGTPLGVGKLPVAFGAFVGVVGADCPRATPACDDADPITADFCAAAGGCGHTPLTGIDAVRALVGTIDATIRATSTAALGGPASARALADAIANVQAALTPAGTGSRAVAGRQLGRVAGTLAAGFRTRSLDRDVGLRLLDLARAARTRLRAL